MNTKQLIYSNASVYKVSDHDCEHLALAAMATGIERIFVLPSSLPAINRAIDGSVKTIVGVAYPSGAYAPHAKAREIEDLLASGEKFDEIYAVLAVGRYISGHKDECAAEMAAMAAAAQGKPISFIIEAGMMDKERQAEAVEMATLAGAAGIVASTDFWPYDLTFPTAQDVANLVKAAGGKINIVACGGVDTKQQCEAMLSAGAGYVCTTRAYEVAQGR